MDNVKVVYSRLPGSIGGFTVKQGDDFYTIVLNQNLTREKNLLSYQHEINHIVNGDFEKLLPV